LLADFEKIKKIKVAKEKENMQKVEISLSGEEQQVTVDTTYAISAYHH
jgi:hypothetical protein